MPLQNTTETWKPVSHLQLVDTLTQVMQDRGAATSPVNSLPYSRRKLFGCFDLEWQKMEEYGAAVCFRHATR